MPRLRFPGFSSKWRDSTLASVLSLHYGASLPTSARRGGNVPVVGSNGVVGYHDTALIHGPAIVVGRKGSAGSVNWIASDCFPIDTTFYVEVSDAIRYRLPFVRLVLENAGLNRLIDSVAIPGLSREAAYTKHVAMPDADEQQQIAACLSSLDDRIHAEARQLDALKAHKQGLMQQLFPSNHPAPAGHPSFSRRGVADLAAPNSPPDKGEYGDAGRGSLPRLRFPGFVGEWGSAKLGDKSTIVRGGSPRPIASYLTHAADGLNWLKIGDVDSEAKYIERTEEKVIPAALGKTRRIHVGDLILSSSMSFGRPYISKIAACIHDGWLAITNVGGQLDSEFLYYALASSGSQAYFLNSAAGSGVRNLNADGIKQLPVVFPSRPEQQKLAACLSSLDTLIAAQIRKIAALKQHKRGLTQGLFPALGAA